MSMVEWAEEEVALACKKEAPERKEGEWDYGCACYESALKAFKSLMADGHSGMSFGFTKNILMRLMDRLPLTPIEDTEDMWNYVGSDTYQCRRKSSLFKNIHEDGSVTYDDLDRYYCVNIDAPAISYTGSIGRKINTEMFPITFPYYPGKPVMYVCEDFLTDKKNGDFDTVGVFYCVKPNGERIEINRFFDGSGAGWREIDRAEYEERKKKRIEKD